ncbi:MAG TPA: hypothetical protein VM492_08605 [Sumerlaeia bacterium]|nr:hypothetical protein [Sumerlaeia bacterium]
MRIFQRLPGFKRKAIAALAWPLGVVAICYLLAALFGASLETLARMALPVGMAAGMVLIIALVVVYMMTRTRCILSDDSLGVVGIPGGSWSVPWGEIIAVRVTMFASRSFLGEMVVQFAGNEQHFLECTRILPIRRFPQRIRTALLDALAQRLPPEFDLSRARQRGLVEDSKIDISLMLSTGRLYGWKGAIFACFCVVAFVGAVVLSRALKELSDQYVKYGVPLGLLALLAPILPFLFLSAARSNMQRRKFEILEAKGPEGLGWQLRADVRALYQPEINASTAEQPSGERKWYAQ